MRLSDDELTALLGGHTKCRRFEHVATEHHCSVCESPWPCETWRLATEVRDLRLVALVARDWHDAAEDCGCDEDECMGFDGILDVERCGLGRALARYEEGGR